MEHPTSRSTRTTLLSLATTAIVAYSAASLLAYQRSKRNLPEGVRLPPHLTSYIPVIGSGLKLVSGLTRDFIVKTAKKLNAPIFTATINGTKSLFIADPDLVFTIFKESIQEIDFMSLQYLAMISIAGMDPTTAKEITYDKEIQKIAFGDIKKHFFHAEGLSESMKKVQRVIGDTLHGMDLPNKGDNTEWKSFQMFEFVRKFIFFASIGPMFSEKLTSEQLATDFQVFERGAGLLFAEAPSFLTKESAAARERVIKMLMECTEAGDGLSDFMKARKELWPDLPDALARMNIGMFIATVSNSIPSVFWVLYHLLRTPKLFEECAEEVRRVADKKSNKDDCFTLEELDEMRLIESCFKESLRMYACNFISRTVTADFIINPKEKNGPKYLVEGGTRIMAYPQTFHMNPSIFEDPDAFQYDRFVDPTKKGLNGKPISTYFRPFGGGSHLCPGRKFISYETRAFLAILLLHVDMKLEDPTGPMPTIALHQQGLSVAHPNKDPKFLVRMRK